MRRALLGLLVILGAATLVRGARAQDAPAAAGAAPTAVEEAKRFFEQGESLYGAGQYQAALEAYLKSRALMPRASNTLNAAVCLHALKRYDEAFDLFEEGLTKYPEGQVSKESKDSAKKAMADIEALVGRIDVSSNIDGSLVIDGRPRGKLPLVAPVRVVAGKHVVRVLRDGFETFEQAVEVKERATTSIDAKLKPLTSAGRLRIEAPTGLDGAAVTVDGALVGTLPWEGTLAPGPHVCVVAKDDLGTGPQLANVIVGQTVKLVVEPKPLGGEQRILIDPPTAELSIDGVAVGKGRFQGKLPVGAHVIEAREVGYFPARAPFQVAAGAGADVPLTLKVDPSHPRWGVSKSGRFGVEVFGGYGFAPSFGNDSDGWCVRANPCEQTSAPSGLRAGATGIYELPSNLGIFVQAGYLTLSRSMSREIASSFGRAPTTVQTNYSLNDEIRVSGPFAAAGVGYRLPLGTKIDLQFRLSIGAAFVSARDTITGKGSGGGRTLNTRTDGSGVASDGLMFTTTPEIAGGVWLGKNVRLSLGAALSISLLTGPKLKLADTRADDPATNRTANPNAIDAAPGTALDPDLAAYGRFVTIVPQAAVGYWF